MSEKEMQALGRGLAEGLGGAVTEAIDQTLGDAAAQRRRHEAAVGAAEQCASAYCDAAARRMFARLRADERMPKTLNYLERYAAFKGIGDRACLLQRIGQTIDAAERIVALSQDIQATTAACDAAAALRDEVARLEGLLTAEGGGGLGGLGAFAPFEGKIPCSRRFDPVQLAELAREVRASFRTYSQVVADNGVFAAFSEGSDFGKCNGWGGACSWWDDWLCEEHGYDDAVFCGEIPGSGAVWGIPSAVEEDDVEGGDGPARAVEKMRAFNRRRYDGLLDDDFARHVDAFWYGFRKLMEFANGLYAVDLDPLAEYAAALKDAACSQIAELTATMSLDGVEALCENVRKLADEQGR